MWVKPERSFGRGKSDCVKMISQRSTNAQSCWFLEDAAFLGLPERLTSLGKTTTTTKKRKKTAFQSQGDDPGVGGGVTHGTGVKRNVPFFNLKTHRGVRLSGHLHYHGDVTTAWVQAAYVHLSCGNRLDKCPLFQQWLIFQASICDPVISPTALRASYVIYKAAAHTILTRCDDATLYPVSF